MLAAAERGHKTRTFHALGYSFALRSPDPVVVELFEELYAPCAAAGLPDCWYSIVPAGVGSPEQDLVVDARWLVRVDRPSRVLRYLTWHVNHQVISRSARYVLLHASAAEKDGVGVLLPGGPEAGKTTLVAGLVRSGFGYLTDEAAALHPETLEIEPYPKPLSIDPGSWSILADLAPHRGAATEAYFEGQWQVNPATVRPDAVSGRALPALVIFPRYVRGSGTELVRVPRAEALVTMMQHTFHFHDRGRRNLDVLARLLRNSTCYRLTSGDLAEACRQITSLIERETAKD